MSIILEFFDAKNIFYCFLTVNYDTIVAAGSHFSLFKGTPNAIVAAGFHFSLFKGIPNAIVAAGFHFFVKNSNICRGHTYIKRNDKNTSKKVIFYEISFNNTQLLNISERYTT